MKYRVIRRWYTVQDMEASDKDEALDKAQADIVESEGFYEEDSEVEAINYKYEVKRLWMSTELVEAFSPSEAELKLSGVMPSYSDMREIDGPYLKQLD